jgi:hypothetical protein
MDEGGGSKKGGGTKTSIFIGFRYLPIPVPCYHGGVGGWLAKRRDLILLIKKRRDLRPYAGTCTNTRQRRNKQKQQINCIRYTNQLSFGAKV